MKFKNKVAIKIYKDDTANFRHMPIDHIVHMVLEDVKQMINDRIDRHNLGHAPNGDRIDELQTLLWDLEH